MDWYLIILWAVIGGIVGSMIGGRKNRYGDGLVLGVLLGPVGWLIAALMDDHRPRCPSCRSVVDPLAVVCAHCRRQLVRSGPPPSEEQLQAAIDSRSGAKP